MESRRAPAGGLAQGRGWRRWGWGGGGGWGGTAPPAPGARRGGAGRGGGWGGGGGGGEGGGGGGGGGGGARRHQPQALAEVERVHIEKTLRFHGGNRTRAAKELGISRATLINKIKAYGLDI